MQRSISIGNAETEERVEFGKFCGVVKIGVRKLFDSGLKSGHSVRKWLNALNTKAQRAHKVSLGGENTELLRKGNGTRNLTGCDRI